MEIDQSTADRQLITMRGMLQLFTLILNLSGVASLHSLAQSPEIDPNTFLRESDFMQFITVEAYEVRIELIARCETLVADLDFPLAHPAIITPQEQQALIERAKQYFSSHFTFFPQGVPVPAAEVNGDILRLGAIDSVIKEELVEERLSEAVLGIAYRYPLDASISYFEFSWNRLPGSAVHLPVQISTPEGLQNFEFSEFVLSLDWSGEAKSFQLPKLVPISVTETSWLGRPKLTEKTAGAVLAQLITNIYTAFEYPTESSIYDSLAKSVAGEELNAIYLEYRRRIEAVNRGGPSVKILNVLTEEISSIRRVKKHFIVEASWRVSGRVRHFGHVHERTNQYRASLTLTADEGIWKLLQIENLEERRLR